MRLLFIGDVVGKPGRKMIRKGVPFLRQRENIDLVIVNAENAAAGSGLTPSNYKEIIAAGVDGITLGDHIYRRKEIAPILENESNIVRLANYPPESPGKEFVILTTEQGLKVAVFSLLGRVFLKPVDCPFHAADRILAQIPSEVKIKFVDFHAEATSDKQLMGRYLDGKVSAVLGTHTHVTTADEQILPGGTAFQCDVGMTGPYESILGRRIDRVMETTLTSFPTPFDVASGDIRLAGSIVDIDEASGHATSIRRISLRWEEVA